MKKQAKDYLSAIDIDGHIDSICKDLDLTPVFLKRGSYVENAIPTGSLLYDLITGGGNAPGRWTTLFGPEGGGKSTFSVFAITSAIKKKVRCHFFDHEGSLDPTYSERMGLNISKAMGLQNKNGSWQISPFLRYYQPDTGEETFRYIRRVLKSLPDKVLINDQWWLIFKDSKKTKHATPGSKISWKDILKKSGLKVRVKDKKYWVESPDEGKVQAVFFIDSLAQMVAEARDADDEKNPMAVDARMFSVNMKNIKALLAKKRCSVIATNQIRSKIGGFGNPEYEPGGNAPKHTSDMRMRLNPISVKGGTGPVDVEPCWDGNGKDKYRHISMQTIKNKSFSPFRKAHNRIWFEERGQPGRGIDPVYDAYQYLLETGQVKVGRARYEINIPDFDTRAFTWKEFKSLILNPDLAESVRAFKLGKNLPKKLLLQQEKIVKLLKKKSTEKKGRLLSKKLSKLLRKQFDLRRVCRKQIDDGTAFELYFTEAGNKE